MGMARPVSKEGNWSGLLPTTRTARHSDPERPCHPSTVKKEEMTMTIVEAARRVTGGVDTHLDVHGVAALDPLGGLLGSKSFETTPAGYKALLAWLEGFG